MALQRCLRQTLDWVDVSESSTDWKGGSSGSLVGTEFALSSKGGDRATHEERSTEGFTYDKVGRGQSNNNNKKNKNKQTNK